MEITLPDAYAAACKLIGEQQVQIVFMQKALAEALAETEQLRAATPVAPA